MSSLLVLHQGAMGDFLLSLPVVQACRETLVADEVVVVASAASAHLAAGRSIVDRWVCPEMLRLYRLFCADLEIEPPLAELIGDAAWVLNLLSGPASGVHERLAELTNGELVSVDPRPSDETREKRRHISQQWTQDIRQAGWSIDDPRAVRIQARAAKTQAARGDKRRGSSRIMVHPGSGGAAKCWPIARFVELVDSLVGHDITWIVGPADGAAARALEDRSEPILFESDLAKAAEQMAARDLYVGNDAGATHLAAALGVSTIAIFGTTDPGIWRPLGDNVITVSPEQPESGMDAITVEQVRQIVLTQLRR